MSIAVSVTVHPSVTLRCLLLCVCSAFIAGVTFLAVASEAALPVWLRLSLLMLAGFAVFVGLYHDRQIRKILHIEISGNGAIHVTGPGLKPACVDAKYPYLVELRQEAKLLPESTVWPCLLLLRLALREGQQVTIPVLQDSLNGEEFRALSLACNWITRRAASKDGN